MPHPIAAPPASGPRSMVNGSLFPVIAQLVPIAQLVRIASIALTALIFVAPPQAAAEDVVKSPSDHRDYRYLELDNGLKALLVSDPSADTAAASLDVNVGSGSDPESREGLAHFLEHMLFLGTEKYPRSGEYRDFITEHGGSENAYTSFDHTNYFFYVNRAFLEPALDRFSQFFTAPLFNADYVGRERQVVHSEYTSKLRSDGRRIYYAAKQALNPAHPASRFAVGNNETLADREQGSIRDELVRFYRSHYSAGIMTLAVLGTEPLAVLEEWVRAKFSAIPNTSAGPLTLDAPLFAPGSLPARLNVIPIKEQRRVSFRFPVPSLEPHYRTKPVYLIADLLGHEGKGSLLSLLKEKGWAEGLSAGGGYRHENGATFDVSIPLTREGLEHIDEITSLMLRYIELIDRDGITAWRYDELRRLNELAFRFAEKAEPAAHVRRLASNLHEYPARDVMRGAYLLEGFQPELTRRYLSQLTPDNMLMTVIADGLDTSAKTDWFSVDYKLTALGDQAMKRWHTPGANHPAFALSEPNRFIPEDVSLREEAGATPIPTLLAQSPGFELWHQQDTTFKHPRTNFYVSVRSQLANDSPRHAVLTRLFTSLVNDQLQEFAYPASLAGMSYSLYKHLRGFTMRLSGYSDKEEVILARILEALTRPALPADRFQIIKERTIRRLENTKKNSPYNRAMSEVRELMLDANWTAGELLEALSGIEVGDLASFVPTLTSRIKIVALAHGNLRPDEARTLGDMVKTKLLVDAEPAEVPRARVVKLSPGVRLARQIDNSHSDSAIVMYYQGGEKSIAERARAGLLVQMMSSQYFASIRTERQLGYVVFASSMPIMDVPALAFVVQSPVAGPRQLETATREFVAGFATTIDGLEEAEFTRHKKALISRLLEKETTLKERTNRYWHELDSGYLSFDLRRQLAGAVDSLDLKEVRGFYRQILLDERRRSLVITATGNGTETAAGREGPDGARKVIDDLVEFRDSRAFFPR